MNKCVPSLPLLLLGSLFWVFLAACATSSPQVAYYSLLSTTAPTAVEKRNDQLILSVGPVTIPDVLKKPKIAIGGTDGRFIISEYHRWAGEVDRDFARALAEQLAGKLGTEQVILSPGDQHITPNCQVLLDVLAMDGDLGKEARMTVRWTLIDPNGKWASIARRSHFSENLSNAGYNTWVTAQQHNIGQLSEEIAALVKERMHL
jgi:uncharacterized protein